MRWLRSLDIPAEWLWLQHVMIIAAAILIAVVVHSVAMRVAGHAARRTASQSDDLVIAHIRQPLRWVAIAIAVSFAMRLVPMSGEGRDIWRQVLGFGVPALLGWLAVSALRALQGVVYLRADISVEDNLRARRKRTRAQILGRIGIFLIVFLTVCLMLLSVPGIRTIGVTLMASAGIAGLVVGAAAQPALKNLIAGVQMAFTEPIRLDDVVIIDNEWGRIEQIHLTFVVVRIWDERRLVVPVAKFLENSFQNWTRETSQLLGSVFWYLDPAADIPRLRTKMGELVEASTRWDRRFFNMQVTDTKPDSIEVRGLMTARDASTAFDLRWEIREGLLEYIRREMPEALPRRRLEHVSLIPPLQGEGDHAQHGGGGVPQRTPLAEAPLRQR